MGHLYELFFTVNGRIGRMEHFLRILAAAVIVGLGLAFLAASLAEAVSETAGALIFVASIALIVYVRVTLAIRRLHDLDLGGWWCLIMPIPVVGALFQIYLFFWRGTKGPNRFGPDPLVPWAPATAGAVPRSVPDLFPSRK